MRGPAVLYYHQVMCSLVAHSLANKVGVSCIEAGQQLLILFGKFFLSKFFLPGLSL